MDSGTDIRTFIEVLPFSRALGMRLEESGVGRAVISLPYDARLVGDPRSGVIHGGAVSSLMDTTCGAAVISLPEGNGMTATLDLRIDYMRAARPGERIICEAICYHTTRSVAFVRATASEAGAAGGTPVASAVGAFTFEGRRAAE